MWSAGATVTEARVERVLAASSFTGKYDVIVCDPPWPSGEEIMAEDKSPLCVE